MMFGNIHGLQMSICLRIGSDLIIRDMSYEPQVSHAYSIFLEWERVRIRT